MSPHSLPKLTTDDAAEAFLDQDLSDLDFTRFQPLDWQGRSETTRTTPPAPGTSGKTEGA